MKKTLVFLVILTHCAVYKSFGANSCIVEPMYAEKGNLSIDASRIEQLPGLRGVKEINYYEVSSELSNPTPKEDVACRAQSNAVITYMNGDSLKIEKVVVKKRVSLAQEVPFADIKKDELGERATLVFPKNTPCSIKEKGKPAKIVDCESYLKSR